MKDFLTRLNSHAQGSLDVANLLKSHNERLQDLDDPRFARYAQALSQAKNLPTNLTDYSIKDHIVKIGEADSLSVEQKKILLDSLKNMIPWRKGPFEIFGEHLDSEWRSDWKWERLKKHAGSLQGRTILDIGCNNGYYLFLLAKQNPKFVLGIDPTLPYYCQFEFLKTLCPPPNTAFSLHGIEHLPLFEKVFDVVFCLGIVYHHTDPIGMLRDLFRAMRPGGQLIVESMGIPGEQPYALLPANRYLGMPGHWWIPTQSALENLLRRAGFQYVETFFTTPMETTEQRPTPWAPYDSYENGLDDNNPELTKEGYPAPMRFYVKARRARVRR